VIGGLWKWLVGFGLARSLIVAGLVLTLFGAGFGFFGVWVSEDQALAIGLGGPGGENRERDLQHPTVQNLLRQSSLAMAGFGLIVVGTALQIAGVLMSPHHAVRDVQMAPAAPPRPPPAAERDPRRRPRAQRPRR
jgi:hypothetical protein